MGSNRWGKSDWGAYPWGLIPWSTPYCSPFDAQPTAGQTLTLNLSLPADKWMEIDWGDGSERTPVVGPVSSQDFSHTYSDAGTYPVRFYGDYGELTRIARSGEPYISGDISRFNPLQNLQLLSCGANRISGNVKNMTLNNLTTFYIYSSCTIEGDLADLLPSLISTEIGGQNSLSGNIGNLPTGLKHLYLWGKNTVYGDLADLPSQLDYVNIRGFNTISDYSGKTWTTKPSRFEIIPVSPGGLSTAEVDQLLIDLDADLTWSSGDVITLTGANAPRSSASDAAVNNLIAEGVTVTTN